MFLPMLCMQIKQGEQFVSETDTEVIPKLCKFIFNNLNDKLPFPKVSICFAANPLETRAHWFCEWSIYASELPKCRQWRGMASFCARVCVG